MLPGKQGMFVFSEDHRNCNGIVCSLTSLNHFCLFVYVGKARGDGGVFIIQVPSKTSSLLSPRIFQHTSSDLRLPPKNSSWLCRQLAIDIRFLIFLACAPRGLGRLFRALSAVVCRHFFLSVFWERNETHRLVASPRYILSS